MFYYSTKTPVFVSMVACLTIACSTPKKTNEHDWLEAKSAVDVACHRIPLGEHDIFFQDLTIDSKIGILKARSRSGETRFYPVSVFEEIIKNQLKDISPDKSLIFLQKFFHAATKKTYLIGLNNNSQLKIYDERTGKILAQYFDEKSQFVRFEVVQTNGQPQILGFYSETDANLLGIATDLKILAIKKLELSSSIRLINIARDSVVIQATGRKLSLTNMNATLKSDITTAEASIESFNAIAQGKNVYASLVEGESMAGTSQLQVVKKNKILAKKTLIKDSLAHFSEPGLCSHNTDIYVSVIKWLDQDSVLSVFKLDQDLGIKQTKTFALMAMQNHIVASEIVGSTYFAVLRSKADNGWNYDVCSTELF